MRRQDELKARFMDKGVNGEKYYTARFEITAFGQTRVVDAEPYRDGEYYQTKPVFAARIGHGLKNWPVEMTIWPQADGSFKPSWQVGSQLRREARMVGWMSEGNPNHDSRHNSATARSEATCL